MPDFPSQASITQRNTVPVWEVAQAAAAFSFPRGPGSHPGGGEPGLLFRKPGPLRWDDCGGKSGSWSTHHIPHRIGVLFPASIPSRIPGFPATSSARMQGAGTAKCCAAFWDRPGSGDVAGDGVKQPGNPCRVWHGYPGLFHYSLRARALSHSSYGCNRRVSQRVHTSKLFPMAAVYRPMAGSSVRDVTGYSTPHTVHSYVTTITTGPAYSQARE